MLEAPQANQLRQRSASALGVEHRVWHRQQQNTTLRSCNGQTVVMGWPEPKPAILLPGRSLDIKLPHCDLTTRV